MSEELDEEAEEGAEPSVSNQDQSSTSTQDENTPPQASGPAPQVVPSC